MFLSSPLVFSQQCLFFFMAFPIPRKNLPPVKFSSYYLMIARKLLDDSQKILDNCEFGLLYAQVCFYCDLLDPSPLSILWAMGSWSGNLSVNTCRVVSCTAALQLLKICTPLFYCTVTSSSATFISLVSPC